MMMIEVTEHKLHKMEEYTEDALHAMGRLMNCLETLGSSYGERSHEGRSRSMMGAYYGDEHHGGYDRMHYRGADDEYEHMDERRTRRYRDAMGRYR